MATAPGGSGRGFDRRHNVTTHAVLFLSDLDPEAYGEARSHATHYEGVPILEFRALLDALPDEAVRDSTFVDVGAGMGRAVLIARERPFKAILGIELSPALHAIATENLASATGLAVRCRDVRLVCSDARRAHYPRGDLVVFLYNPFDAEVLDVVLDRLAEREGRTREWILYHTPEHAARIEARGYRLAAEVPSGRAYAPGAD